MEIVKALREEAEFYGGDEYAHGIRYAADFIEETEDVLVIFKPIVGQVHTIIPVSHEDDVYFAAVRRRGQQVVCSEVHKLDVFEFAGVTVRGGLYFISSSKAIRKIIADKAKEVFTRL
jgi:hypothetical protein